MTDEETRVIVTQVLENYYNTGTFSVNIIVVNQVMEFLRLPVEETYGSHPAEKIREYLWNIYTGGGVSVMATKDIYKNLGREAEIVGVFDE